MATTFLSIVLDFLAEAIFFPPPAGYGEEEEDENDKKDDDDFSESLHTVSKDALFFIHGEQEI